jgi:2-polyprenyl-3-methyl-5-hydroxy-6-metoxy-1,4-benzoquinol methylase
MKQIIIVFGIWGVGKSYYCENFIKAHPEFEICNADTPIEELAKKKWIIMDYWFNKDWNANKLRKLLNPEVRVEIRVLYDDPEEITRRQIYLKENDQNVSLYASIDLYSKDLKELIYIPDAKYFYKEKEITYEEFRIKLYENQKPYTKEKIFEHIEWMKLQKGYDWQYHEIDFPYGIKIGKEGYSRNKAEWEVIKDIYDWKNKQVADLAGNNGYFSQEIWFKGGNPTLVDIHLDVLYSASIIARIKGMDFKIIKKDLNIGFPEGNFHIALCMNVLHHIKNQELLFNFLKNIPLILFAINRQDVNKIDKYFNFIRVLNSPKENRMFCLVKPK